ncbi:hypothetical protein HK101_004044 [Irineochytrium annulatum]|nr:hypothetical protein HK101_004044 [Irineochytrium annulatum]
MQPVPDSSASVSLSILSDDVVRARDADRDVRDISAADGSNTLPLSILDAFGAAWGLSFIYFFEAPPSGALDPSAMKLAVARTLCDYPSHSGKIVDKGNHALAVDLCDHGARLVVASCSSLSIEDLVPVNKEVIDIKAAVPKEFSPAFEGKSPFLLQIQSTFMKCGGVVLSVIANHALNDGQSAFDFMTCLTRNYSDATPDLSIVHDRSCLNLITKYEEPTMAHPEYDDGNLGPPQAFPNPLPSISCKLFRFSSSTLARLKAAASAPVPSDMTELAPNVDYVTTQDALQAHITSLITMARLEGSRAGQQPPDGLIRLNTGVNGRKRLDPPLPAKFAGNAIFNSLSTHRVSDLLLRPAREGLPVAARRIRAGVNGMTDAYVRDALSVLATAAGGPASVSLAARYFLGWDVLITSWARMGLRDARLGGDGAPVYAGPPGLVADGVVVFLDSAAGDEKGLDVWVSLCEEDMEKLVEIRGRESVLELEGRASNV